MAKTKKFGYVEPADYFPEEIRKMFEEQESEKSESEEKKNPYKAQSKRMIEKKKTAKK